MTKQEENWELMTVLQIPWHHTALITDKEDREFLLKKASEVKAAIIKQVKAAYNQQSKGTTISLNAIYGKLAGKVSYNDIKLAVAFF